LRNSNVTPDDRIPFWKKKWGTPRLLDEDATEAAFDEFLNAFVPTHMHKQFVRLFWSAKPKFANRFFVDGATFHDWETKILNLANSDLGRIEAIVMYGSPDRMEAHLLKGESRRSLRDVVMDDRQPACAIVRVDQVVLYLFVEPKMRGCVVRIVHV
jgi:hypothetical protein